MQAKFLAGFVGSLVLCVPAFAGSNNNDAICNRNTVIAEIDGTKLTIGDLERKRADSLFQAQNNYYQVERNALNGFVDEYLLEQQGKKENVTVEQLLERHVNSTLPKDPSEESLRVYYEGLDTKEPFEAVRDKILEHIREVRLQKARTAYLQSLRSQWKVVISLPPPRANTELRDTPFRGRQDAPVILVEYADYECPYCQQVLPELANLANQYKDKLAFAFKDSPLPMHAHAQKAAEAARCAGLQGKYWEYHDLLFANKQLDISALKEDARKLNLDTASFDKCLDSGAQAAVVKAQLAEAQSLGLQGTPSFFINGRFLSGVANDEAFREIIDQELASSAAQPKHIPSY